ncbi:hypothetical protein NliqN6_4406 [Naganishia liquefaciens]|uniref:Zn(2)-C6 fungal-type domain-containing protein n=1 Tax=Naganishia liquefaciens TaxID=104408 RepID=A0A8H3TVU9_9TREE|nr:hypothetical protein NliqN6_4406 [Naganishia liquefaciens]
MQPTSPAIPTTTTTDENSVADSKRSAVGTQNPVARTGNEPSVMSKSPVRPTTNLQQGPISTGTQPATHENTIATHGESAKSNSNIDGNGSGKAASPEEEGDKGRRPCDMCRKRKIKCTPLDESESTTNPESSNVRCRGCNNLDIPCTYLYVNKRPGRPSKKDRDEAERTGVKKPATKPKEKKAQTTAMDRPRDAPTTVAAAGTVDQKTGSALGQAYPPVPYQQFQQPTPPQPPSHKPFGGSPSGTSYRPTKRARTDSQSQDPAVPQVYDESSFAWTPGLSIGSFGDPGTGEFGADEFAARGRSRSGGREGAGELFGMGNASGSAQQQQQQQRSGGESSLQPFVPNFAGFSVGKADERGYGQLAGFESQGQGHGHAQAYAPPRIGPQGEFYAGPSRQEYAHPEESNHQRPSSISSHLSSSQPGRPFPPNDPSAHDSTGKISNAPLPPRPQIEDVTSWSSISFFISLHLRYQHCIMPILHKPTFNSDLALRLDRKDEQFRAFLLSLVAYVICQVPRSKMIGYFTQQELEALQSRCRAASRLLQDRQRTCNTLTRICTYILDYFYSQTVGDTITATMLLSQGARLAYCLGLHEPTPVGANGEKIDHVALQLRRRIFFQLYNTDKTDASSGMQILMNDFEGVPPYPLCVDDELITTEGNLPQPVNRPSYMTGFVANVQLMQILSECMRRHRTYQTAPMDTDVYAVLMWIERAQTQMRQIIQNLPDVLGPNPPQGTTAPSDQTEVFATQRANLLITAVSAEFALLDLKAMADPNHDIAPERELVGREMYSLLSSIPVEHLAANGESMRGKVLRIIIALLSNSASPEFWNQHVRDWWEIYSKVQFVQMIPMNVDSLLAGGNGS